MFTLSILVKMFLSTLLMLYFQFNNKYFKQEDDLPVGSPISAVMSEYIYSLLKKKLFAVSKEETVRKKEAANLKKIQ